MSSTNRDRGLEAPTGEVGDDEIDIPGGGGVEYCRWCLKGPEPGEESGDAVVGDRVLAGW